MASHGEFTQRGLLKGFTFLADETVNNFTVSYNSIFFNARFEEGRNKKYRSLVISRNDNNNLNITDAINVFEAFISLSKTEVNYL